MKKDYTNANKKFYDKSSTTPNVGKKDKLNKSKIHTLIYIFNNLGRFENLIKELLKIEKRYQELKEDENPFNFMNDSLFNGNFMLLSLSNIEFVSFYVYPDKIDSFFKNLRKEYYVKSFDYIEEIITIFLKEKKFSRGLFIKYLLKEFKNNPCLKNYGEQFDFDMVLELAMEYKEVLEVTSKKNRDEILGILELVEV